MPRATRPLVRQCVAQPAAATPPPGALIRPVRESICSSALACALLRHHHCAHRCARSAISQPRAPRGAGESGQTSAQIGLGPCESTIVRQTSMHARPHARAGDRPVHRAGRPIPWPGPVGPAPPTLDALTAGGNGAMSRLMSAGVRWSRAGGMSVDPLQSLLDGGEPGLPAPVRRRRPGSRTHPRTARTGGGAGGCRRYRRSGRPAAVRRAAVRGRLVRRAGRSGRAGPGRRRRAASETRSRWRWLRRAPVQVARAGGAGGAQVWADPEGAGPSGSAGPGAGRGRAGCMPARRGCPMQQPVVEQPAIDPVLVDDELAEHERWGSAAATVGEARVGGPGRVGGRAGRWWARSAASCRRRAWGRPSTLTTRAASRLAVRRIPVPVVGAIIGGAIGAMSLLRAALRRGTRGACRRSSPPSGRVRSGTSGAANTIDAVVAGLDVAGNAARHDRRWWPGLVAAIAWALAIPTLGGVGRRGHAGDRDRHRRVAGVGGARCHQDLLGQSLVLLFRSLHSFTSDADPRAVQATGGQLAERRRRARWGARRVRRVARLAAWRATGWSCRPTRTARPGRRRRPAPVHARRPIRRGRSSRRRRGSCSPRTSCRRRSRWRRTRTRPCSTRTDRSPPAGRCPGRDHHPAACSTRTATRSARADPAARRRDGAPMGTAGQARRAGARPRRLVIPAALTGERTAARGGPAHRAHHPGRSARRVDVTAPTRFDPEPTSTELRIAIGGLSGETSLRNLIADADSRPAASPRLRARPPRRRERQRDPAAARLRTAARPARPVIDPTDRQDDLGRRRDAAPARHRRPPAGGGLRGAGRPARVVGRPRLRRRRRARGGHRPRAGPGARRPGGHRRRLGPAPRLDAATSRAR